MDRRIGQHGPELGSAGGQAVAAARFRLADLLARLLPDRGVARGRDGKLPRASATREQTRQVPVAFARKLRVKFTIRLVRKVVRFDRKGQPAQRVEDALRSEHIPGERPKAIRVQFINAILFCSRRNRLRC